MHNGFKDRYRRKILLGRPQVKNVLPDHFKSAYPKFISLLEKYYDFLDENDSTELLQHLFQIRDVTETDITLLSYIEDELLLGEQYFEGFVDKRAAANFSSILFRSKGSRYSIEWFFRSFFGIDSEVFYPKTDIFKLNEDDSRIGADYEKYLTDNKLYQTFSLLVRASIPISQWKDIFKLFVHPAGMYLGGEVLVESLARITREVSIEPTQYLTPVWSFTSGSTDEGSTHTLLISSNPSPPSDTHLFYRITLSGLSNEAEIIDTTPNLDVVNYIPVEIIGGSAQLQWALSDDNDYAEGDEIFTVTFYDHEDPVWANELGSSTITIGNILPVYTVTVSNSSITEGVQTITGTMTTSHPNGFSPAFAGETVTLSFTGDLASDIRVSNLIWDDGGLSTVVLNTVSKSFTFDVVGSDIYQGATTGAVRATSAYAVGDSPTITITDLAATGAVNASSATQSEGGGAITFDPTFTNAVPGSNVYYWLSNLTDMTSGDFSGSPAIGSGNRVVIGTVDSNGTGMTGGYSSPSIELTDDIVPESGESYRININVDNSGTALANSTITVNDNDTVPDFDTVTLFSDAGRTLAATSFNEGDTIYGRLVTSGTPQGETITYSFINGDTRTTDTDTSVHATSGNQDFTLVLGSDIPTINGSPAGLIVRCSSSGTYANNLDTGTITIVDETISYTASAVSSSVTEGSLLQVEYTATLVGGASYENLNVAVADNGDSRVTAGNYAITSTQFGLADPGATGVSTVTLSIGSTADPAINGDGTIEFVGTGAVYGQGSVPAQVDITVTDATPSYGAFSVSPTSIDEDGTVAEFELLASNVGVGVTVDWISNATGGVEYVGPDLQISYTSAVAGFADLTQNFGTITRAGDGNFRFWVRAIADLAVDNENPEDFIVTIAANDSNATATGGPSATLEVNDTSIPANAPTVTPNTTSPTEGDTVTFTFGEAAGSAAQTYYFNITHDTTSNADFTADPPGNGATARTTVTWDGSVFSPTSVAVTLAGAGGADGVDDNEIFTGKLFDAVTGGTQVATTANITVTDDPAAGATVQATMDIHPMFPGNDYTFTTRNSVFDSGNPTAARAEAMFMVEETGGSIIVKLAIAGQPAGLVPLRGGYEVNTSTTGVSLDYVSTSGDPAADPESAEIFRIDSLPVTGWSVRYAADNINTFGAGTDLAGANAFDTADASGTGSTNISYVSNHTQVASFYDQMTTSAQLITGGVRGQKAHYFGVTAVALANQARESGAIGSYRLIFSRSGQTDISVDIICDIGAVADGS